MSLFDSTQIAIGHRFVHYIGPNDTSIPSPGFPPSPHADLDLYALRSLDFFLNSTATELEQPFGTGIWSGVISCLLHSQPAVKYGLIALAALHENYQYASESTFAEHRKVLALEHYTRSVSEIVQLNKQDSTEARGATLVASLLFCAIESLQGHFQSAMKHVTAGIDLLNACEDDMQELKCLPNTLFEALRRIFTGLAMQSMAMEDTAILPTLSRHLKQSYLRTSCSFTTIDQALAEIALLQTDGMRVLTWAEKCNKKPGFPSLEIQQANQALHQRFHCWNLMYRDLVVANTSLEGTNDHRTRLALLTLRVNQHVTRIMLSVVYTAGQTAFDALTEEFEGVVSTAEEIVRVESEHTLVSGRSTRPMFGLTLGIVAPVFFTCVRCRDHSIRHRALSFLRKTARREAVWDARIVSPVAEKVVAVEEEAAAYYRSRAGAVVSDQRLCGVDMTPASKEIPEFERIHTLQINWSDAENTARLSFTSTLGLNKHEEKFVWDE